MPELPDVAVFKKYVDATVLHQEIAAVDVSADRVLRGCSAAGVRRRLKGNTFRGTQRHGKFLGVELAQGGWLMLHFGMTGEPQYVRDNGEVPAHARLVVRFRDGGRLAYLNQRRLGQIHLADDFDAFIAGQKLGPDALVVPRETFCALVRGKRGTIKTRLMNQNVLAGLGNIYTDEVLFQAGMHPGTAINRIRVTRLEELWRDMRRVLRTAIRHDADPHDMPRSWLLPHRDTDEVCPNGHGPLKTTRIGGRGTYFCPKCQAKG